MAPFTPQRQISAAARLAVAGLHYWEYVRSLFRRRRCVAGAPAQAWAWGAQGPFTGRCAQVQRVNWVRSAMLAMVAALL